MKFKLSFSGLLFLPLAIFSQVNSIQFEDPKDAEDFNQFQKEQLVRKVDSLNTVITSQDDFYTYTSEGQIELNEASALAMPKFNSQLEKNYYFWLKKKLYNAYPFYLQAIRNYENLNDSLKTYGKNRKIKKYIKKRQKELADAYETQLRDLTRSEGQILMKLMYRRTGLTTYEIIKELRGNLNAYVWEAKAGLFDISLKKEFDPFLVREDYYLDNLVKIGQRNRELELEDE